MAAMFGGPRRRGPTGRLGAIPPMLPLAPGSRRVAATARSVDPRSIPTAGRLARREDDEQSNRPSRNSKQKEKRSPNNPISARASRVIRDPIYDLVTRNRYRWFGRRDACILPNSDRSWPS